MFLNTSNPTNVTKYLANRFRMKISVEQSYLITLVIGTHARIKVFPQFPVSLYLIVNGKRSCDGCSVNRFAFIKPMKQSNCCSE